MHFLALMQQRVGQFMSHRKPAAGESMRLVDPYDRGIAVAHHQTGDLFEVHHSDSDPLRPRNFVDRHSWAGDASPAQQFVSELFDAPVAGSCWDHRRAGERVPVDFLIDSMAWMTA